MIQNGTKQDVLRAIDADEQFWNRVVDAVGPEYMEVPGAMGDWTFKDLAAHIFGWRVASLNRLEGKVTGTQPADPGPASLDFEDENADAVNDWLHNEYRDRAVSDVLADLSGTYDRLRSLVQQAPEEKLFDPVDARDEGLSFGDAIISGEYFSHFSDEHQADVQSWLESLGRQLPERSE
jgi:hypothetical protein